MGKGGGSDTPKQTPAEPPAPPEEAPVLKAEASEPLRKKGTTQLRIKRPSQGTVGTTGTTQVGLGTGV